MVKYITQPTKHLYIDLDTPMDLSNVSICNFQRDEKMLLTLLDHTRVQIGKLLFTLRRNLGDKEVERRSMEEELSLVKNFRRKVIITLKLWHDKYGKVEEDTYGLIIDRYNDEHETNFSWEQYFNNYFLYV